MWLMLLRNLFLLIFAFLVVGCTTTKVIQI